MNSGRIQKSAGVGEVPPESFPTFPAHSQPEIRRRRAERSVLRRRKFRGVGMPSPDRVLALITRLALSPYSAGGTPVIISIDWMASSGTWLEKILLYWSVIG